MKFAFIAKHRTIWPVAWLCDALGVSQSGFHAWLNRSPSAIPQRRRTWRQGQGELHGQRPHLSCAPGLARLAR
jgi:hypothetical protein